MNSDDNAPAWLFSFVDLAFLMIIAMTQVGGDRTGMGIELGEVIIPKIQAGATTDLPSRAPERWQLRVFPRDADEMPVTVAGGVVEDYGRPFELALPSQNAAGDETYRARLSIEELRAQLAALHATETKKPLLAPHADSRSQDMLDAIGVMEELWPSRRRATVSPVFARQ
jgi:hypothetical protein